jgi:hypothetical protein
MQPTARINKAALPAAQVRLRPFPHPYRAGLAIASDIDRCDRDTFIRLHQYLNCPRRGLGLPVADSFFGVGKRCHHMAYFMDDGRTPSEDADLIGCGIESGLIDTLHSWGAFDVEPPQPHLLRQTAERLTQVLAERGLSVAVWSNHGAPSNRHNLWARTEPQFVGDDPASDYYTGDLLGSLGIRFVWASELLPWPLSGQAGRQAIGRRRARLARNALKNLFKRVFVRRPATVRAPHSVLDLAYPTTLRDGQTLLAFNRFNRHPRGIWGLPTRHTLRHMLHPSALNRLVAEQGYLIAYTHLGMPPRVGQTLFAEEDARALAQLAERYHSGEIWVAPAAVLLKYWLAARYLRWEVATAGESIVIRITVLDDPTRGPRVPQPSELAGICFYTPRPDDTLLFVGEKRVASVAYGADATGQGAVGAALGSAPETSFLADFVQAR